MRRTGTPLLLLLAACTSPQGGGSVCKLFKEAIHEHAVALDKYNDNEALWADVVAARLAAEAANALRAEHSLHSCGCTHWEIAETAWEMKAMNLGEAEERRAKGLSERDFAITARARATKAAVECSGTKLTDSTG